MGREGHLTFFPPKHQLATNLKKHPLYLIIQRQHRVRRLWYQRKCDVAFTFSLGDHRICKDKLKRKYGHFQFQGFKDQGNIVRVKERKKIRFLSDLQLDKDIFM